MHTTSSARNGAVTRAGAGHDQPEPAGHRGVPRQRRAGRRVLRRHPAAADNLRMSMASRSMSGPAGEAGVTALEEFRSSLSREDIARYLAHFGTGTGVDSATQRLRSVTGGHLDLRDDGHRVALINWLRAWGCRHLRRADTGRTSEALRGWWAEWGSRLPRDQDTLTGLGEDALMVAGLAYDDLRARPAARRSVKGTDLDVAFGDTAAGKRCTPSGRGRSCRGMSRSGWRSGGRAAAPRTCGCCGCRPRPWTGWPGGWRFRSATSRRSSGGPVRSRPSWWMSTYGSGSPGGGERRLARGASRVSSRGR